MSSYLLASKFSFLANPLNTLFNSHSHAVGSLEEQVKLRSVRLSRSHVFPFLARCCDRILFCLSAFLFIMQSRQTLWFLTSQLCPSDLIYKHRLWQLRAAQGQTSSLTNTQVVILYLLFLINLQSNPLFSPRAGQRSGSLRHPRSFSGKRLKYLLTQELKLKRSAMLFFFFMSIYLQWFHFPMNAILRCPQSLVGLRWVRNKDRVVRQGFATQADLWPLGNRKRKVMFDRL